MISLFPDLNKYELFSGCGLGRVLSQGELLKCLTGTAVLECNYLLLFRKKHF